MMGINYTGYSGAGSYAYEETRDPFNDRAQFEYKISIIPRRCYNTDRRVWGTAVRGRRVIMGPGDSIIEDRWYHRHEAVLMMLTGSV